EDGLLVVVELHALAEVRVLGAHEGEDALVLLAVVDDELLHVLGEEITGRAEDEIEVRVHEARTIAPLVLADDLVPDLDEEADVALELLGGDTLGHGADNEAGPGGTHPLDDVAQPLALLVVADAAADADVIDGGHEDQVPAGDGDVAGEAGALGADGILGDLDHDLLTDLENVLDARLAGGLDLLLLAVLPTVAIAVAAVALAGFLGVAGRALLAPDLALVAPAAAATSVAASLPRLLATLGLLAVPGLGLHRIAGVGGVRGLALCCRAGFPAVRVIRAAGVIGRA